MTIDENAVVEGLKNKEVFSMEYIINRYGRDVFSLAGNIMKEVGRREDVEECASEVFVQVWEKISQYSQEKGSLRTWILILAKYLALDYRRKLYQKIRSISIDDIELAAGYSIEENIIHREDKKLVIEAINNLGDMDRRIFYKRYFFYESIESIACCCGLTREAVDNRLFRSRKRIKEFLNRKNKEAL